eukprot:TRINITY_DN1800_c0_g3_i1.p1 TRINITY_DN1800_c0_g3~~TRINITY_DN1800_c0_g3_i1.p1  ORF type:complete len:1273 (-),score=487.08 TRINITY_DN1800_c0_g3_i1:23-3841(-)
MDPLWFFGGLNRDESEEILKSCAPNSVYLVRDSSVRNHYALSRYSHTTRTFGHELLAPTDQGGYMIKDSPNDTRIYSSIRELVTKCPDCKGFEPVGKFYKGGSSIQSPQMPSQPSIPLPQPRIRNVTSAGALQRPNFNNPPMPVPTSQELSPLWYYEDINRADTERLLSSSGQNALLIRTSSVPGNFALSRYDASSETFSHQLIAQAPGGFRIEDSPNDNSIYPSIQAVVSTSPDCSGFIPMGLLIPRDPKDFSDQRKTTGRQAPQVPTFPERSNLNARPARGAPRPFQSVNIPRPQNSDLGNPRNNASDDLGIPRNNLGRQDNPQFMGRSDTPLPSRGSPILNPNSTFNLNSTSTSNLNPRPFPGRSQQNHSASASPFFPPPRAASNPNLGIPNSPTIPNSENKKLGIPRNDQPMRTNSYTHFTETVNQVMSGNFAENSPTPPPPVPRDSPTIPTIPRTVPNSSSTPNLKRVMSPGPVPKNPVPNSGIPSSGIPNSQAPRSTSFRNSPTSSPSLPARDAHVTVSSPNLKVASPLRTRTPSPAGPNPAGHAVPAVNSPVNSPVLKSGGSFVRNSVTPASPSLPPRDSPTIPRDSPIVPRDSPMIPRDSPTISKNSPMVPREIPPPPLPRDSPTVSRDSPMIPRDSPTISKNSPMVPKFVESPAASPMASPAVKRIGGPGKFTENSVKTPPRTPTSTPPVGRAKVATAPSPMGSPRFPGSPATASPNLPPRNSVPLQDEFQVENQVENRSSWEETEVSAFEAPPPPVPREFVRNVAPPPPVPRDPSPPPIAHFQPEPRPVFDPLAVPQRSPRVPTVTDDVPSSPQSPAAKPPPLGKPAPLAKPMTTVSKSTALSKPSYPNLPTTSPSVPMGQQSPQIGSPVQVESPRHLTRGFGSVNNLVPLSPNGNPAGNLAGNRASMKLSKKEKKEEEKERKEFLKQEKFKMKQLKKEEKRNKKLGIKKMEIAGPVGVTHVTHIGYGKDGFQIHNIPAEWKTFFGKAGVSQAEMENPETMMFLMETVSNTMSSVEYQKLPTGLDLPPAVPAVPAASENRWAPNSPPEIPQPQVRRAAGDPALPPRDPEFPRGPTKSTGPPVSNPRPGQKNPLQRPFPSLRGPNAPIIPMAPPPEPGLYNNADLPLPEDLPPPPPEFFGQGAPPPPPFPTAVPAPPAFQPPPPTVPAFSPPPPPSAPVAPPPPPISPSESAPLNSLQSQIANAQLKAVKAGSLPPMSEVQETGLLATLSRAMNERRLNIREDVEEEDEDGDGWSDEDEDAWA